MLTAVPKVGDLVFVTPKDDRNGLPSKVSEVKTLTKTKLTIDAYPREVFSLEGYNNWFELWDSKDAYARHFERDRNITTIKKAISAYHFGKGLSDEVLEQIVNLIEITP